MRLFRKLFLFTVASVLASGTPHDAFAEDSLESGFRSPPDSAKPHTWWHWMNGNVTREGITADLEAMKSAGLGGAQLFHVGERIPAGPAGYMSPLWQELVQHAVKEAGRVGIELCIHNCPGWSSSGGPWIDPEHSMQVIAWSHKPVHGPSKFSEVLPKPTPPQVLNAIDYYKDIAVFAFPTPQGGEKPVSKKKLLGKTGVTRQNLTEPDTSSTEWGPAVQPDKLLDLTARMDSKGRLTWDVPAGDWIVLRMGTTPTGAKNRAAPPEGLGLEVDKLSQEALDLHWNSMMAKVIKDAGPLAGKVLNNGLIDSYEVGNQNWTPKFRQEFQKRRGYDPMKYFPVIAGRTIGSTEESERFLWDYRLTIADLYADNYYGHFRDLCHNAGLQFSTEAYGNGGFDNLQCGGLADIPMGEFWISGHYIKSSKLGASSAHTNGRKFVGAEAFTASLDAGRFKLEPYGVKTLGDLAFCYGINRYIFHRYAHQPWMNLVPGMTMGKWGMHLERTQTWWNEAAAWFRYIARCQHLLQEGKFVGDVLYFVGEGTPNDLPERGKLRPTIPEGYDYDGCDVSVLMNRLSVKDGKIMLPDGMSYRILVLPESKFMTPAVAEKIRDLVKRGATVVGPKPEQSPSLADFPKCDAQLRSIADEVWGSGSEKEHQLGKGRVFSVVALNEILNNLGIAEDFEFRKVTPSAELSYIHRKIGDAEVYFVSNQLYTVTEVNCTFRVKGLVPELWQPESGKVSTAAVYREDNGRTVVPLRLEPAEAVFIVFRKKASESHLESFSSPDQPVVLPRVTITEASYETVDGAKAIDATTTVSQMVAEGHYDIPAVADLYGDPMRGAAKQLRIAYVLNDKPTSKTVGDRDILDLADVAYTPAPQTCDIDVTSTGSILLTPWVAGKYEFRKAGGTTESMQVSSAAVKQEITSPWTVNFPADSGAPSSLSFPRLISWTEHQNPGVRYFSGSANYRTEFEANANILGGDRSVVLDLGRVKNFATVKLNGKELGVLWKAPFRIDVGGAVKPGKNVLEVKVTNLWPNRLIGDEQLPADAEYKNGSLVAWPDWLVQRKPRTSGRITFATWKFYDKDSPLLESGLIGTVVLKSAEKVELMGLNSGGR